MEVVAHYQAPGSLVTSRFKHPFTLPTLAMHHSALLTASVALLGGHVVIALTNNRPFRTVSRASGVPYGTVITSCTQANTFALTFDDGPYEYTSEVLDTLEAAGMRVSAHVLLSISMYILTPLRGPSS